MSMVGLHSVRTISKSSLQLTPAVHGVHVGRTSACAGSSPLAILFLSLTLASSLLTVLPHSLRHVDARGHCAGDVLVHIHDRRLD
eukprot:2684137-Heterocapsa_arctica.AAC.1